MAFNLRIWRIWRIQENDKFFYGLHDLTLDDADAESYGRKAGRPPSMVHDCLKKTTGCY